MCLTPPANPTLNTDSNVFHFPLKNVAVEIFCIFHLFPIPCNDSHIRLRQSPPKVLKQERINMQKKSYW